MNNRTTLTFLFLLLSLSSPAQVFLNGDIIDNESKQPIAYVNININSTIGTASNENGEFHLKIATEYSNQQLTISCIGYSTATLSIDSLLSVKQGNLIIQLTPFTTLLPEVKVTEKRIPAIEIVKEALLKVPENYIQTPFNMEFYSKVMVLDESKTYYLVETIVDTYREGYVANAINHSNVLQKRITGESPIAELYDKKQKVHYFPYESVPAFNIFMMDNIGVGNKYNFTIFNSEYINKVDFQYTGISIFENDSVYVIEYQPKDIRKKPKTWGKIYISSKSNAILKHTRGIDDITLEVSYRKWGNYYFPYFFRTIYPENKKDPYQVVFEAYINRISTKNVSVIGSDVLKGWHLSHVPYNASFWEDNYPIRK